MADILHANNRRHPEGLLSPSFLGLLATQFLGAMNDNIFRWLVVPIGKEIAGPQYETVAVSAGLAMFVLPFILLAAPAGWLADRFSKRAVIVGCKVAEVVLMVAGVATILSGNIYLMFTVLFLMGAHAAIFGPSKYGAIPELVRVDRIPGANGLVGMTTILAIVLGTLGGGYLYAATRPRGIENWWISAAVLLGVAAAGMLASLFIHPLQAANPARPLRLNFAAETLADLRIVARRRAILWAAVGSAFFWSLAGLFQINVDLFATRDLGLLQQHGSWLLAVLALGVGAGNILAALLSKGKIELGLVGVGAALIGASAIGLSLVPSTAGLPSPTPPTSAGFLVAAFWLLVLGVGAGFYDVPLQSYLQHHSPVESRGSILAAASFLTFLGTVGAALLFALLTAGAGLSGRGVFLLAGLAVLPVLIGVVWLIPFATIRFIAWVLTKVFYRVEVSGLENLPAEGGGLLVANHVSWIDGLMLHIYSPRRLRMIAWSKYVDSPGLRWINRVAGTIAIDPGNRRSVLAAVRTAREAIAAGELVCLFPEGALTRTGHLHPFQPGALSMVKGSGRPVIPVYLGGFWGSIFSYYGGRFFWKRPKRVPYPLSIRFGRGRYDISEIHELRAAVAELGVETMHERKHDEPVPARQFLRTCKRSMRRSKVADSSGMELTGGRLLIGSLVFRRLLRRQVLAADERYVGVLLPPSVGGVLANAALAIDRRIAVNLNYTFSSPVLNHCIARCGIRHVVTSRRVLERFPLQMDAEPVFVEDLVARVGRWDKLLAAAAAWLVPVPILERWLGLHRVDADDTLTVVFTSGSTGMPKGVVLSQHNVGANVEGFNQVVHLRPDDVMAGILPFFHSFGYTVTLWAALMLEPKVVYHYSPLEAKQIGQLCRKHKATIFVTAPTFLRGLLRRCEREDFAHFDVLVTGAEKLPPSLADEFEEKFGIRPVEGYGTTELSPVVSANIPPSRVRNAQQKGCKEGTVGQPLPGIAVKVVDPETGVDLGTDRPGMLLVKGPNVMQGYLGEPERTAEVLRDGWYTTGDIAVVDEEGFIRITGRQSRFSKLGGEMVPHVRIEEVIVGLLPPSEDETPRVAVTAVPDPKKGERLIVLHTGLGMTADELTRKLAEAGLPSLWIPSTDSYFQVEAIPVLGTGKLDLKAMGDRAAQLAGTSALSVGP